MCACVCVHVCVCTCVCVHVCVFMSVHATYFKKANYLLWTLTS